MFLHHHRKVRLLFALLDIVLVVAAFEVAYLSRKWLPLDHNFFLTGPNKALLLGFAVLVWLLMAFWSGLYSRLDAALPSVILRESLRQSAGGAIGLVVFEFVLRLDLSRVFLGLFALFAFIFLVAFRLSAGRFIRWKRGVFGRAHYVVIVGTNERALEMGRVLEESAQHGIRLLCFVDDSGDRAIRLGQDYPVRRLDSLGTMLEQEVVDEVVCCVESGQLPGLEDLLLMCDEYGVRTRIAIDFFPHVHSEMYLDWLSSKPLLTFAAAPHDEVLLLAKRAIDVALALPALVLAAPLFLIIAMAIRLTSPGPVIFSQVRCGLNGRRFTFYKFRSMVWNAEALKADVAHLNNRGVAFKIPSDPRMTPLGRWLRKFSIDEWPQLWNVLKGDMSLVGPRPAVPQEVEQYQRWQRRRLRMRPGLTCLWAIEGRDHLDFETWMRKDMEYIDTWSLGLDWKIMALTLPRVLSGRGAH